MFEYHITVKQRLACPKGLSKLTKFSWFNFRTQFWFETEAIFRQPCSWAAWRRKTPGRSISLIHCSYLELSIPLSVLWITSAETLTNKKPPKLRHKNKLTLVTLFPQNKLRISTHNRSQPLIDSDNPIYC